MIYPAEMVVQNMTSFVAVDGLRLSGDGSSLVIIDKNNFNKGQMSILEKKRITLPSEKRKSNTNSNSKPIKTMTGSRSSSRFGNLSSDSGEVDWYDHSTLSEGERKYIWSANTTPRDPTGFGSRPSSTIATRGLISRDSMKGKSMNGKQTQGTGGHPTTTLSNRRQSTSLLSASQATKSMLTTHMKDPLLGRTKRLVEESRKAAAIKKLGLEHKMRVSQEQIRLYKEFDEDQRKLQAKKEAEKKRRARIQRKHAEESRIYLEHRKTIESQQLLMEKLAAAKELEERNRDHTIRSLQAREEARVREELAAEREKKRLEIVEKVKKQELRQRQERGIRFQLAEEKREERLKSIEENRKRKMEARKGRQLAQFSHILAMKSKLESNEEVKIREFEEKQKERQAREDAELRARKSAQYRMTTKILSKQDVALAEAQRQLQVQRAELFRKMKDRQDKRVRERKEQAEAEKKAKAEKLLASTLKHEENSRRLHHLEEEKKAQLLHKISRKDAKLEKLKKIRQTEAQLSSELRRREVDFRLKLKEVGYKAEVQNRPQILEQVQPPSPPSLDKVIADVGAVIDSDYEDEIDLPRKRKGGNAKRSKTGRNGSNNTKVKKKRCGLCEQEFPVHALDFECSNRAILQYKAANGEQIKSNDPRIHYASRMYELVKTCSFCHSKIRSSIQ